MERCSVSRTGLESAQPTAAKVQPRPFSDPQVEQPQQSVAHDFSHVDLFSHAPKRTPIQMKFTVGEPNDRYEQEADRVAEQVLSMAPPTTPSVQRQSEADKIQTQSVSVSRQPIPPNLHSLSITHP